MIKLNSLLIIILVQKHFYFKYFFIVFLLSLFFFNNSAFAIQFSGIVLDTEGQPISKAIVRLQGTHISTFTNQKGQFTVNPANNISSKYITAWKSGFYNGGQHFSKETKEYRVVLKSVPASDNKKYTWVSSFSNQNPVINNGSKEEKTCQFCHPIVVEEWRNSIHATSAKNPLFLSFFNGTNIKGEKEVGPVYKQDFPNSHGNCATCHVPALGLDKPFNSDPNKAEGVTEEGIFCDFCHKITNTSIDRTGGLPGVLSIQFKRPEEGHQTFFGPFDDSFPGDNSYHPLYKESQYCAPCHHGKFWNVLVYSEFQEWTDSPYAEKNIQCQDCHMKPTGRSTHFATEKEGGILREPAMIPSHINYGIKDISFMSNAIELKTQATLENDVLTVSITIKNTKAGHHYPTGSPMRNMILLVDVFDENGKHLSMIKGERVPVWGGIGVVEDGNYAGLPGKGFAKILKDVSLYPDGRRKRRFRKEYPAPYWRPTYVESDNRIPACGSDTSSYQFHVTRITSKPIYITTKLIYRRAYKKWLHVKGFDIDDMEISQNTLIIRR